MSDTAKDVKVSLKVMVNKEKTKVLFAEADNDFANVLLSFLTLPLGRIAKILEKHYGDKSPVFGSISSLYKSLANLDDAHFSTNVSKLMLLDPTSSFDSTCRNLKLDISYSKPTKYFTCEFGYDCNKNISMHYSGIAKCDCGRPLNKEISDSIFPKVAGVFTKKNTSFIISDDLKMVPYSIGFFQTLSNIGVTDTVGAELRNVTLGTDDEIMNFLKCCLLSTAPLTDFILNKGEIFSLPVKPEPEYFLHKIEKEQTSNCEEMIVKLMVHKSRNKVLFAQADEEFIELLFSFLIIPIAGAESLLDSNTCLENLDNLYRSVSDFSLDKYFTTLDTKKRLMNPSLPLFYKSENSFLPLVEEISPTAYKQNRYSQMYSSTGTIPIALKSPRGDGNYVVGPKTFMVTDDLKVTPFCMSASLSFLNGLNIALSDVEELGVHIGLQEGLSILKASLASTSALTNGLINRIMTKQPKQEH